MKNWKKNIACRTMIRELLMYSRTINVIIWYGLGNNTFLTQMLHRLSWSANHPMNWESSHLHWFLNISNTFSLVLVRYFSKWPTRSRYISRCSECIYLVLSGLYLPVPWSNISLFCLFCMTRVGWSALQRSISCEVVISNYIKTNERYRWQSEWIMCTLFRKYW